MKYYYLLVLLLSSLFLSCEDTLRMIPENSVTFENAFENEHEIEILGYLPWRGMFVKVCILRQYHRLTVNIRIIGIKAMPVCYGRVIHKLIRQLGRIIMKLLR